MFFSVCCWFHKSFECSFADPTRDRAKAYANTPVSTSQSFFQTWVEEQRIYDRSICCSNAKIGPMLQNSTTITWVYPRRLTDSGHEVKLAAST